MTSRAGPCARTAAWSASALSTACISGIRRWCATRVARARALGVPAVALSFEPLPREFFAPADAAAAPAAAARQVRRPARPRRRPASACCASTRALRQHVRRGLRAQRCWCDRLSRARSLGRPGVPFRQGPRAATSRCCRRMGAEHGFTAGEIEPVLRRRRTRVEHDASARRCAAGDFDARRAPARPPLRDRRPRRARQATRPHARLSRPPTCASPARRPALSGIYATWVHGVGDEPHAVGVEPRHAADRGRRRAIARSASVRLRRRPVRPAHRGRVRRQAARRSEIRRSAGARPRRCTATPSRRAPSFRKTAYSPERTL